LLNSCRRLRNIFVNAIAANATKELWSACLTVVVAFGMATTNVLPKAA
jgi:hypothetical protein